MGLRVEGLGLMDRVGGFMDKGLGFKV